MKSILTQTLIWPNPTGELAQEQFRGTDERLQLCGRSPARGMEHTHHAGTFNMREGLGMARTFHNPRGRRRSTAMPAAIGTCHRRAVKPRGISEDDGALPVAEVKSDVVPAPASAWRQQRGKWGRLHGGRDSSAWHS